MIVEATEVGMAANIRLTLPPSVVKYVVVEAFLKKRLLEVI